MRNKGLETFKRVSSFCFDVDISDAIMKEALNYYSFEEQREREKRYNKDGKKTFSL